MTTTSDRRIASIKNVITPQEIINSLPIEEPIENLVNDTRQKVSDILHGKDKRLLVVVGPCSIHDPQAALEYAGKLVKLREELKDRLEIVMRVYFEKPRTTVGWKGLINDPDLDGSFHINKGLRLARELLLQVNRLGLPAGSEFLDIVTGQYYADLISWGAIGARTTESQVHRELASGLSCPVGFKNGTDGNVKIAIDAIHAAREPHIFLSPTQAGTTAIYQTTGNSDAHVILRGGKKPNYDAQSVSACVEKLNAGKIDTGVIIDCSHANSEKQHQKQIAVCENIAEQIKGGQSRISGVMIESHLVEGRQNANPGDELTYGQSITDACIGWEDTDALLRMLADQVIV
ncbi:Phospho-2-dehydro-3-deoxyheptonate aldolase, Phe-sensitive [Thalassocella blandensis]|nr:Phospho-2-dehydro-3-deoxyheptonate aldolase, Phe-sensitive [Thalassocella blandensis]